MFDLFETYDIREEEPSGDELVPRRPAPGKVLRMARYRNVAAPPVVARRASSAPPTPSQRDDDALAGALQLRGGAPLAEDLRADLEARFGGDLSGVRIHTDDNADAACMAAAAEAFTVGDHIFFSSGAYRPASRDGFELLCHEVTHVVQHYDGRLGAAGGSVKVSQPSDSIEREADSTAARMSRQRPQPRARRGRPKFRPVASMPRAVARRAGGPKVFTLRLFGATYRVPLQREAGSTTTLSVPLRWRVGRLHLTHAELELDSDFEVKQGAVTTSLVLGHGMRIDNATIRFDGTGRLHPKLDRAQLRLGRHATLTGTDLVIHRDGAVSGRLEGKLSNGHTLPGGLVELRPGAWLAVTLHHNNLTGLTGGGARLRVDKLDLDMTVPELSFGRKGRKLSWAWLRALWKYVRFPRIKLPSLSIGRRNKGPSKVKLTFDDAWARFEDNTLTAGGTARMWYGKRSIGVDVTAEVSRSHIDVRIGPKVTLPKIEIPLTKHWRFWRPRNGLYPLVPNRAIGGKGKSRGALNVAIGAGFGFEVRKTSLEALVKLTPPKLRGGVRMPGVELQAHKVPDPKSMFKAKMRVRAQVSGGLSLPLNAGSIGLRARGDAYASLGVHPTLKADLSSAGGLYSGGLRGQLYLVGHLRAQLGLDMLLSILGISHTEQVWKGALKMQRPIGWSPRFSWDFGKLGPDEIGERPLVKEEHFNSLARDFDEKKQDRAPKTSAATTHLDRIQRVVEIVLTAVDILTPLHSAIGHFKAGEIKAGIKAAAMSPSKLYHACIKFYNLVEKSSKDGTFGWMEKFLPGGRQVIAVLEGYMKAVDTTARGFAKAGRLIGREDPWAAWAKTKREVDGDNAAAAKATRARRELMRRGADPMSAWRVLQLTYRRHAPKYANEYPTLELYEIQTKLNEKLPKADGVRNKKRAELEGKGVPRDIAYEVACIWRLAYVNSTNDSWRYVEVAKEWEKSAIALSWNMMAPVGDRRYFQGLVDGWLDRHHRQRIKLEKGIK